MMSLKCETCKEDLQPWDDQIAFCAQCSQIQVRIGDEWVPAGPAPAPHYLVVGMKFMPAIHVLQELAFKSWSMARDRNLSELHADRLGFKNLLDNLRRSLLGDRRVQAVDSQYEHEPLETSARPMGTRVVWRVQPTQSAMMVTLEMDLTEELNQCAKALILQVIDERQTFNRTFDLFATMFTNSEKETWSHADTVMRLTRKKTEKTT